jgi:hypothetical protein
VWFGPPPDPLLLAPCCLFAGAIIAWMIAALGALAFSANGRDPIRVEDALAVGFIACVLVIVVYIAPSGVAAILAALMAAHAAFIAIMVAVDFVAARAHPAAPNRLR